VYDTKEYCTAKNPNVFGCQSPTYYANFPECKSYSEGERIVVYENADVIMYKEYRNKRAK
jgi:hypothetical protein